MHIFPVTLEVDEHPVSLVVVQFSSEQGCRSFAALRLMEPDQLRFLIDGNAMGFALSFPKAE